MTVFTIYLCRHDGTAATFEIHEAHSDEQALALAELILARHPTAAYSNVWDGERKVGRVDRYQPPPEGAES